MSSGGCCPFYYTNYLSPLGHELGFTDVPPDWYPRYYEYRMILQDFLFLMKTQDDLCTKCSGELTAADVDAVKSGVPVLYNRAAGLYAQIEP